MAHAHDEHHAPVADGDDIPQHGPVLEEPRSPAWLPYLGAALMGCAVVWWLSTPNADEEARAAAAAAASASASASAAASAAETPPPAPTPTVTAVPAPTPPPRPAFTVAPTASLNPAFVKKK